MVAFCACEVTLASYLYVQFYSSLSGVCNGQHSVIIQKGRLVNQQLPCFHHQMVRLASHYRHHQERVQCNPCAKNRTQFNQCTCNPTLTEQSFASSNWTTEVGCQNTRHNLVLRWQFANGVIVTLTKSPVQMFADGMLNRIQEFFELSNPAASMLWSTIN